MMGWFKTVREALNQLDNRVSRLEKSERLDAIERAIAELQVTNAKDLEEFRERLDMHKRRRPARSFRELVALAERGEVERAKQNA